MTIKIQNYKLGRRVASFAKSDNAKNEFEKNKLSYFFLCNNRIFFDTGEYTCELESFYKNKILLCNDFDIFYFDSFGNVYKVFDSISEDNGLMLTSRCNSNCIMCPASNKERKSSLPYDTDELIEIIKHYPTDVCHITITGGEPFLIGEKIFELFHELKERLNNTKFLLLTNGRALSNRLYASRFAETMPRNIIVGIPLHGYDSNTHDFITKSPGGFVQTTEGIKNLLHNGILVELRIVVSKLNMNYIKKIAEMIAKEFPGVLRVEIMALEMLGNAAVNREQVWIPYKDAFKATKEAIKVLVSHGLSVGLYNFPLCAVEEEYRS